ncbi:MAG: hypothetical protein ABI591_27235 [Kofleriaceae bacterium]
MRSLVVVLALVGCGSNDNQGTVDASTGVDGDTGPMDAPGSSDSFGDLMPHVVGSNGVIAAPKVVAITYANDPNRTDYETFFTQYAASTAWTAQANEYGVGALTVGASGRLTANAPASLTESQFINNILKANLTGANPLFGAPDANTIYQISIPPTLPYDDGTGAKCCTDYLGYHSDAMIGGVDVPFVINCACAGSGLTALQNLTETANHETVEAATDPLGTGFAQTDDEHAVWTYTTDGEVADLCEYADTANLLAPTGMTYAIQRTWSNAAAHASTDPCIPGGVSAYYQTIPTMPDAATVSVFGSNVTTKAKQIAKGASGTVTMRVYSTDASTGPYTVTVDDWNGLITQPSVKLLAITQPVGTYNAGDTVSVQITVNNVDAQLGGTAEAFQITTKPASGPSTYFYGMVAQ